MYICQTPLHCYIKMSKIKEENLIEALNIKKENYQVRITTQIRGGNKNKFLEDCIKKNIPESKMASHIIDAYYSIYTVLHLEKIEHNKIKDYIISKIKL